MNRLLMMGCAALALLASTQALAKDDAGEEASRCANYAKIVTEHVAFKDGNTNVDRAYDPFYVKKALKECPSQTKVYKALDTVLDFEDVQATEDGPKGQTWAPGITTKESAELLEKAAAGGQEQVDGYKQRVKKGDLDAATFKTVCRYMVWQRSDLVHMSAGLELMARMYPEDYASLKTLSQEADSPSQDLWASIGHEWLPKPPPAKH